MNSALTLMKARFSEIDELFRAREYRERLMIGCMATAAVFFSIDSTVLQPISAERERIELGSERTNKEVLRIEQEVRSLKNIELTADERRAQDELEQLERQLTEIEAQMGSEIAELIPPQAIISVLEEVLAADEQLKLVKLESQKPTRIGQSQDGAAPGPGSGLYRHGLVIEIEGNFSSTLDYLRRLESSRWNLLWDRFEYQVQKFPTATVTIELHTLSEQEEWIGV